MHERRKAIRMPYTDLPEILRSFTVIIGKYKGLDAKTVDASTDGIGLSINVSSEKINLNDSISMSSKDNRFNFNGEIVFLEKKNDKYYVGVKFI